MKKIRTVNNRQKALAAIFFVILFAFSLIVPSVRYFINGSASYLAGVVESGSAESKKIILINITGQDVDALGWPLKRSYYALLIDRLEKLNVGAIGLTIFFPRGVSSQSVYNNLLFNELKKKHNVALGAIAEGLNEDDLRADSVRLPFFAKLDANIPVGHLNYFEGDYILIPNEIQVRGKPYYSFALALSRALDPEVKAQKRLYLNANHSWRKFKSYSLLEFFDLVRKNNLKNKFEGKAVIIGVSAPTIAKTLYLYPFGKVPGIGLMALATENILNQKGINFNWFNFLKSLFWLAFLLTAVLFPRKYWVLEGLLFLISFVLLLAFNIAVDFSAIVLPAVAFLLSSGFNVYLNTLKSAEDIGVEKEKLERELKEKIRELREVKSAFEKSNGSEREQWQGKITELTEKIEKLKEAQKDEEPAEATGLSIARNFQGIIYRSSEMAKVVGVIKKVAPSNATVLITGESGSGKELVAKAIHNLSARKNKAFVSLNCAAVTESLLESELFGHVKGAFTSAVAEKIGLFEAANGGTIFLDEIGETSLNFQAKLLRVLQNGEYQKVGSPEKRFADVRIIAATNKNLKKAVAEKEFREDLFYRLNVVSIQLPPLRKRKDDIPVLAEYFLKKENPDLKFSQAIVDRLSDYDWPGNVRELESVVKRAAIFAAGENRELVHLKDLPDEIRKKARKLIDEEILNLLRLKKFSHSSIKEVSDELGISRTAVGENLRGWFFKFFVESNLELEEAARKLAASNDAKVIERVKSKGEKYIANLKGDLAELRNANFEEIKERFLAKYKNLPQKFHAYLDAVIKGLIDADS